LVSWVQQTPSSERSASNPFSKSLPAEFDGHFIRRVFDEATKTWWFSVIDVVQVLAQQPDCQTARKYWNKPKERLSK